MPRPGARFPARALRWGSATGLALCLVVGLSGCRLLNQTARMPIEAVTAVVPTGKSGGFDPAALQIEVQRFADEYASRTTATLDDYATRIGTPAARSQALSWKVAASSAVVGIASGSNPQANLLDLLALATITRTAIEEVWVKTTNGVAFEPWLEVSRALETDAWKLAAATLSPEQQEELRQSIRRWWESNPGTRTGFFVRPTEFRSFIRPPSQSADRSGSVFSLVGLDPTSGLDPAVREVTRTRMLAERALFMAQRMPFLLRWQTELLTDQFLQEAQVGAALDSAKRLSRAAESASQTAARLAEQLPAERQAILDALAAQEGKLRALTEDVTRALIAGEKMSTSLNTTITTFDGLMKRFGVGEPDTSPPDTNSPPFSILDYAHTAERIAAMAQQLDALIKDAGSTLDSPALDQRIASLGALAARARADAEAVLHRAFLLAAGLILLAFAAALVYRRTGRS